MRNSPLEVLLCPSVSLNVCFFVGPHSHLLSTPLTLNYLLYASEYSGAGDQAACVSTEWTGPTNLLLHVATGPPFFAPGH